jgi:hypothetical protein
LEKEGAAGFGLHFMAGAALDPKGVVQVLQYDFEYDGDGFVVEH